MEGTSTTGTGNDTLTFEKVMEAVDKIKGTPIVPAIRIHESLLMVEDGEPYEIQRTWKERLFSRPWRPLKSTRTIMPQIPRKEVFMTEDGIAIAHPEIAKLIRKAVEE